MSTPRPPGAPKGPRNFAKSRNGCAKCKAHRRKCDEAKPSCRNCIARDVVCPGYQKSLKWSTKHELVQTPGSDNFTNEQDALPWPIDPLIFQAHGNSQPNPKDESGLQVPPSSAGTEVVRECADEGESSKAVTPASDPANISASDLVPDNTLDDQVSNPRNASSSTSTLATRGSPSKSLLRKFYQLPPNNPTRSLIHEASMLVEHYFKDVCGLYSSFDSTLNPFRMSVARSWSNSASIYYAIQSMSAAHLSNTYSSMEPIGIEMKRLANMELRDELISYQSGKKTSDCALLVTLLLGLSACWHQSNDLGLGYLRVARMLMYPRLAEIESKPAERERQDRFFEEALIYWEMMMAFVTPKDNDPLSVEHSTEAEKLNEPDEDQATTSSTSNEKLLPHPWTGVAPKIQMLFAEVAQLVRRERTALDDTSVDWVVNGVQRRTAASRLEEQLLTVELPKPSALVDSGDGTTSSQDFIVVAEATRCAALLEIYRVFPENLQRRLGVPSLGFSTSTFGFNDDWSAGLDITSEDNTGFLNSLALHVLDLVAKLPSQSGTRFLQLLIIVVAASELRCANLGVNLDFLDLNPDTLRILNARSFALERLGAHANRLPAKPVRLMIELVNEVWRRLDLGEEVFWLDVMIANGWETVMG